MVKRDSQLTCSQVFGINASMCVWLELIVNSQTTCLVIVADWKFWCLQTGQQVADYPIESDTDYERGC